MALVLTLPAAPAPVGPGYTVTFQNTSMGPIPVDDYYEITVTDAALNPLIAGSAVSNGSATAQIILGILGKLHRPPVAYIVGAAAGAAASVFCIQRHANNAFVQSSGVIAGWTWDPTTGIGMLLEAEADLRQQSTIDVTSLLNRTFINAP